MASTLNATTNGVKITSDATGALDIQVGGTNAIQIGTGATATITNATITSLTLSNPPIFPAGSASAPAITTTGDTNTGVYFPAADQVAVTAGGTVAAAFNSNGVFFRNRIINGDMRIDQRNAGAAVTTSASYPVDRFIAVNATDGAFSAQQDTSVPAGAGFVNSLKFTTTTADASLAATQFYCTFQRVEGNNIADWGWGAAGALTVTLSFWVRSSLTGTFGGALRNGDSTRSYPFNYSISAANTWEYKTITVPGDTTGTWATNNSVGLDVIFGLGVGSTYSGTAGAWAAANYLTSTGATSVIGTLNATWYVTGVQVESGSVATPFERRPYGTELMLCQRYYVKFGQNSGDGSAGLVTSAGICALTTRCDMSQSLPVTMRTVPTSLEWGNLKLQETDNNQPVPSALTLDAAVSTSTYVSYNTTHTGGTADRGARMLKNTAAGYIAFSAEL